MWQFGVLGLLLGALGSLLGCSWVGLGCSRLLLGCFWSALGCSGGAVGMILVALGALLTTFWMHFWVTLCGVVSDSVFDIFESCLNRAGAFKPIACAVKRVYANLAVFSLFFF